LEHTRRIMGLPRQIWDILEQIHIGRTAEKLNLFLVYDLPAAMQCRNIEPTNPRDGPILHQARAHRSYNELESSCIIQLE
jgi:hypothetical protein